jgi:hypothetical protein
MFDKMMMMEDPDDGLITTASAQLSPPAAAGVGVGDGGDEDSDVSKKRLRIERGEYEREIDFLKRENELLRRDLDQLKKEKRRKSIENEKGERMRSALERSVSSPKSLGSGEGGDSLGEPRRRSVDHEKGERLRSALVVSSPRGDRGEGGDMGTEGRRAGFHVSPRELGEGELAEGPGGSVERRRLEMEREIEMDKWKKHMQLERDQDRFKWKIEKDKEVDRLRKAHELEKVPFLDPSLLALQG